MKLDKLWIGDFKNLRDFSIDFDQESLTTVLVGRNGTGKSNLLEALILIFKELDLGKAPPFKYELEYLCRGRRVKISADPERSVNKVRANVDGATIPYEKFARDPARTYLPNYVFGYYSGPSNRMEAHFEEHQERFYRDLINGVERPLRPLLYARLVHSQFVLLAFFREQDPEVLRLLDEYLWIQGLDHVLFVIRQPPWNSPEGDSRFWRARGHVQTFLDRLYEVSLAPMRQTFRVKLDFNQTKALQHLYLYLKDDASLGDLASAYPTQQEFFKALESTYISKLLSEVRIRVKVRTAAGSLTFRELSEGEQQLLMVLGLLRFTKEDETLFLLDEPDTHLNPAWSLGYLQLLDDVVGEHKSSHVIMTTHDPLTIAGLLKSQVQILTRDDETGRITAQLPDEDPRGMGVGGLLTSDVYGLRSSLDDVTQQKLDEKRSLAAREVSELNATELKRLAELTAELEQLGFVHSSRDRLFQEFSKEMSLALQSRPELQQGVLTREQIQAREKLAQDIISKLKSVEGIP